MINVHAQHMIDIYEEWIAMMTCISLYGPPQKILHFWQLHGNETREEDLLASLGRLEHWKKVKEEQDVGTV